MRNASGGFTIVEVMIVLGISGAMLASAATIFSSRRQTTEFSQAVYDIQSQLQSFANNVSSQAVPGYQQYTCSPTIISGSTRPALSAGSGTNQDCIFLGQVIQVAANSPTIYSYPVFGLRDLYTSGGSDTGTLASTVSEAHPEPAISAAGVASNPNDPNNLLLISSYTMLNGVTTASAKFGGSENDILMLYSSLQDSNTSGNEISVTSSNYSVSGGDPSYTPDPKLQIKQCVEGPGCSPLNPITTNTWKLCVTNGPRQAQISVRAIPTGIATTLNMNTCG